MSPGLVAGALGGVAVLILVAHRVALVALARRARGGGRALGRAALRHLARPTMWALLSAGLETTLVSLPLPRSWAGAASHALGGLLIASLAWLVAGLAHAVQDVMLARHTLDAEDNLRARQLETQLDLVRRVLVVVIVLVAMAVFLLSFPGARAIGTGLLASAGLVGLVAGIAAQPLFSNMVAGIQIALTQPVRTDDVVVIAGEWGRIEEIHLTYAVVKVWDLRRLVVPISFFTTQSFENWTRSTANILGTVYLEVDYSAPVAELRRRLQDVCRASSNWDGQVANLQVTNLGLTMQLRAVVSSSNSSRSWDLQCEVREQLIAFLQAHHPYALPRLRTELAHGRDDRPAREVGEPGATAPARQKR